MVSPLQYFHNTSLGRTIIVKLNWTCFIASLKTLSWKNPMGQKSNIREKEYNALNVHIAPPEMNNLNLATC